MKFLHNINKPAGKQENPLQNPISILDKPNFTLRYKVFQHAVSLIDDETNSTYDILTDNCIYTILHVLSTFLINIEDIEGRINKRRTQLSSAKTKTIDIFSHTQ